MFLSSKTPYWPAQSGRREEMPGHCKLVHINHLGRHGSRHATKVKDALRIREALTTAKLDGGLSPKGLQALQWTEEYLAEEEKHLGKRHPHAESLPSRTSDRCASSDDRRFRILCR